MKILFSIIFITISLFGTNESYIKSTKELREIYIDNQYTIYCNCKYDYRDKDSMIDRTSCGYVPRNEFTKKGKVNIRARRIEWEHVIPAENFGRQFSCWREGDASCIDSKGKAYKGRKCCEKVSREYRIMQADMHNLFPAIGELNADRSNYRFDFELATPKQYGMCEFEVDFKGKRAKVREEVRGIIARDYLYFHKQYNMKISKQELQKFEVWNKLYKPNKWEIERNKRIAKIQGNKNPFIEE